MRKIFVFRLLRLIIMLLLLQCINNITLLLPEQFTIYKSRIIVLLHKH